MRRHILACLAGCCVLSIYTASAQDAPPDGGQREAPPYIVIEDFATTPLDSLPRGWRWRGKDDEKPKLYAVREVNGHRYLAAQDTGHSVVLMKEIPLGSPAVSDYDLVLARRRPAAGRRRALYRDQRQRRRSARHFFATTGSASRDRSNTCGAQPWPPVPSRAAKALPAPGLSCSKADRGS